MRERGVRTRVLQSAKRHHAGRIMQSVKLLTSANANISCHESPPSSRASTSIHHAAAGPVTGAPLGGAVAAA